VKLAKVFLVHKFSAYCFEQGTITDYKDLKGQIHGENAWEQHKTLWWGDTKYLSSCKKKRFSITDLNK
jgi:hypothetical protein